MENKIQHIEEEIKSRYEKKHLEEFEILKRKYEEEMQNLEHKVKDIESTHNDQISNEKKYSQQKEEYEIKIQELTKNNEALQKENFSLLENKNNLLLMKTKEEKIEKLITEEKNEEQKNQMAQQNFIDSLNNINSKLNNHIEEKLPNDLVDQYLFLANDIRSMKNKSVFKIDDNNIVFQKAKGDQMNCEFKEILKSKEVIYRYLNSFILF